MGMHREDDLRGRVGDTPSGAAPAYRCGAFHAGHDPHWIQVLRVAERGTPSAVRDVRLIDLATVELDVDRVDGGGVETLVRRNHDAVSLHAVWTGCGQGVLVRGASLLKLGPRQGSMACFSVTDGVLAPCRTDGATEEGGRP